MLQKVKKVFRNNAHGLESKIGTSPGIKCRRNSKTEQLV
jgi:hypothetical protein